MSHEYDRRVIKIFNPFFIIDSTWKFKYVFINKITGIVKLTQEFFFFLINFFNARLLLW